MKLLSFLFIMSCSVAFAKATTENSNSSATINSNRAKIHEGICHKAKALYHKRYFEQAIDLLKKCLKNGHDNNRYQNYFFDSIDMIARIYIREYKRPEKALIFLRKYEIHPKLNDAQLDTIAEWISVVNSWKKLGKLPKEVNNPKDLFKLGKKYFDNGMKIKESAKDDIGNAHFQIAATYLIPYINNYNDGADIAEALYMMGNIRANSWVDYEFWTDNFYLKEVIRRFPNTALSWKAYITLRDSIHFAYSGSSGDYTPPSQLKMLKRMKSLAKVKK